VHSLIIDHVAFVVQCELQEL